MNDTNVFTLTPMLDFTIHQHLAILYDDQHLSGKGRFVAFSK
jgi:hypothetical protein